MQGKGHEIKYITSWKWKEVLCLSTFMAIARATQHKPTIVSHFFSFLFVPFFMKIFNILLDFIFFCIFMLQSTTTSSFLFPFFLVPQKTSMKNVITPINQMACAHFSLKSCMIYCSVLIAWTNFFGEFSVDS